MTAPSSIPTIDTSAVRRERPPQLPMPAADITPQQMLAIAVQQGADLQKLEKLMELQERWEKNQARKAYVAAMAAAIPQSVPLGVAGDLDLLHGRLVCSTRVSLTQYCISGMVRS